MTSRCSEHGLKVARDGRCVLCRKDADAGRSARSLGALLASAGALLGLAVAGPAAREGSSERGDLVAEALPAARSVAAHTARSPERATPVPSLEVVREDVEEPDPPAEDALLGRPFLGERVPVVTVKAPEPPRGNTDPEPPLPDDPRDFELP